MTATTERRKPQSANLTWESSKCQQGNSHQLPLTHTSRPKNENYLGIGNDFTQSDMTEST